MVQPPPQDAKHPGYQAGRFVINSIVPDVSLVRIFRGAAPFILTDPLRLTLPVVFPWPALLLPTTMG